MTNHTLTNHGRPIALLIAALGALLYGCGGAGSATQARSVGSIPAAPVSAPAGGTVHLFIPQSRVASSSRRAVEWISPATASISIGAGSQSSIYTIYTTNATLSATSPNCTQATGGLACNVPFLSPAGAVNLFFTLFDASGSPLSDALLKANFTADQNNAVAVTLSAIPYPSYTPAALTFSKGVAATQTVTLTYTDADLNPIPPAPFAGTLQHLTNDPTGSITVTPSAINGLTQTLAVHYNGSTAIPPNIFLSVNSAYVDATTVQVPYFIGSVQITVQ